VSSWLLTRIIPKLLRQAAAASSLMTFHSIITIPHEQAGKQIYWVLIMVRITFWKPKIIILLFN